MFVLSRNVINASLLLARQSYYFLMFYSCQKIERMGMCMNFNILDVRKDQLELVICADIQFTAPGSDMDLSFGIKVT